MSKKLKMSAVLGAAAIFSFVLLTPTKTVRAGSLTLAGTAYTPSGSLFTDGGSVNVWGPAGSGWSGIDGSGKFEVTGLAAGEYTLDLGVSSSSSFANPAQQKITLTASVANFQLTVATPALKGTLAKPDGTPTSGCVNVRNSTWTVNRNSCPGDDGAFKIGALDAGSYILEANPPQNSQFVTSEQMVTISNPSTTLDLGVVKLDAPFIIGKIALPDGTLVPWNEDYSQRLHLSADLNSNDWTVNKHSDFDNLSQFKFGRVPAGTYNLHVNIWDTELYTGSVTSSITVPESGLDMTATPVRLSTPQLAGVVYRPDGATPMQNVWVNLHNDDWSKSQGSSTDSNGKYRIGGLTAGTYTLEVNPPNDTQDVVRPDPVSVTITDALTTRNITLSSAKKFVNGSVKKPNGTVVPCANVNANRRDGSGWAGTSTQRDGSYSLTLTPGSWNIRVEPQNSFDCPQADWVFLNPESIVQFSNDATTQTETVNLEVAIAKAKITGKVTTKSGALVTNGNVNANSQTQDGRNRWSNAQIKADGSYTLNLIAGTYDVNVWTQNSQLYAKNQKVSVADNETKTVNFVMGEKLAHIKGTVTSKDGKALANIQMNGNLDCGPEGCSAWSNTKTDGSGNYDLAATKGRWNLNFDGGQNSAYVYDGPPMDVYVSTETSTVTGVDFALTFADVTITGNIVDENGTVFADFPGWAFVRPITVAVGAGAREFGGPVNRGSFSFRFPSRLMSQVEFGVHAPQNSQYSPLAGQTITVVADSTIEKNITVKKNDAAIVGRVVDSSGMPLRSCNFRGEVFANTENGEWHGTQINPDCSYEINLLADTYRVGYHIDESAGFLNRPPADNLVKVGSGTRVQYDVKVLAGDASVKVLVLNPDGTPARHAWVWADNHEEIDRLRQSGEQKKQDDNFRGPGDTRSPEEVLKYCSKKENEKECADFKLPPGSEGPGGCKDALACTRYCQKNTQECSKEFEGQQPKISSVRLSGSVLRRKASVSSLKLVKAQGESGAQKDDFDNMIGTGGETNDAGVATVSLLSGHDYTVNTGLPPESLYMPAKTERVSLKTEKDKTITVTLRETDGKMSGFVTWNKQSVNNGFLSCWSEDGNNNGTQIINGTFTLNYTFNTTYHCNANASIGSTFLHSNDQIITIGSEKKIRQDFSLDEASFQLPPSVSESFDSTTPHVVTLADGSTINIPANALATSGTVTVNANPTINIRSQQSAQPLWYGYQLEATDENGKTIATFKDNITMCFTYTDDQLASAGIEEGSLVPSYWDSSSSSWKLPPNVTHDKDNNKICISSNHFTAYAVVSTSGKGRGQQLLSVTTSKKSGVTKVTIGSGASKKSFTPFPSYKGEVAVSTFTAGKKAGQVIVATQAGRSNDATTLKVYTVKGKLSQTIKPWGGSYRQGAMLAAGDLSKDTYAELVASPLNESSVKIYDFANKKSWSVGAGRRARVTAQTIDLYGRGSEQLAVSTGGTIATWKLQKGKFVRFDFDQRRLRITNSGIERVTLRPSVTSVTPTSLKAGKGTVTITITGQNLGNGSRILLGESIPAKKVTAKGETKLTATIDAAKLKKNKTYRLTVINADGEQVVARSVKTK